MVETKTKRPDIIFREGKPAAVILDIDEYEELLERLEDIDDLTYLKELRSKPLEFVTLTDLLKERQLDEDRRYGEWENIVSQS